MSPEAAFSTFVGRALETRYASRLVKLAGTTKGQFKALSSLDRRFERALKQRAGKGRINRSATCYAFHLSTGFGAEFSTVNEAVDHLALTGGWLIVLSDGSSGVFRPEAPRWDEEVEIVG